MKNEKAIGRRTAAAEKAIWKFLKSLTPKRKIRVYDSTSDILDGAEGNYDYNPHRDRLERLRDEIYLSRMSMRGIW